MPASRGPRLREATVVVIGAVILAVIVTWPLVLLADDHAHDRGDPLFQAWTLDWVQHALGSSAPLWDANIFAPNPRTLAYSDSLLGVAVLLLPVRWLGLSPIGMLNVATLLGYASSAAAGYLFGRVVTASRTVGACTAVVYGFGTYNTFLGQSMNIALHPGPALAATAAWTLAERRADDRPLAPSAAALALAVALQSTVSFNTGALTVVAAAAVLLARSRALGRRGLLVGAAALAGAVVMVVPLAWPYLENARSAPGDFQWSLAEMASSGADFLSVDPSLTVWGSSLGSPLGPFGQPTFPGLTALAAAVGGLVLWHRAEDRRPHAVAAVLVVVGAVLALGTADTGWRQYAPYRLVYEVVPGARGFRATGRFWIIGLLGMGLLAGLAARWLGSWLGRRFDRRGSWPAGLAAGLVAVALCGLVLVEGHRSWADSPSVEVPAVDRALASRPGPGGVVYLPVPESGPRAGLAVLGQAGVAYRTTAHHRPTPNGLASFFPDSFLALPDRLAGLPDGRSLGYLRSIGVRYVVVGESAGPWQALRTPSRARPLRFLGRFGGDLLYEVPAQGG